MHSEFLFNPATSLNTSQRNSPFITLFLVGMILVVLFVLLIIALPAFEDSFEEDDLPSLEIDTISGYTKYLLLDTLHAGSKLELVFMLMRLEHLSTHIGEKPFSADEMLRLDKFSFRGGLIWTTLFTGVVFSVCPLFVRDHSARSCSKRVRLYFIHGGS